MACFVNNDYSGGLVTNYKGHVKGMVVDGRGRSILSTTFILSASIHIALIVSIKVSLDFLFGFKLFFVFFCTRFPNNHASFHFNVGLWQQ